MQLFVYGGILPVYVYTWLVAGILVIQLTIGEELLMEIVYINSSIKKKRFSKVADEPYHRLLLTGTC